MQHVVITWLYHINTALEGQVHGLRPGLKFQALLVAGSGLEGRWFQSGPQGATGTRWGEMGMGANRIENISVGVQRERMHFGGCFICMGGKARICTSICVCI